MGTASTSRARAEVMLTVTGAWSRCPDGGRVSLTVAGTTSWPGPAPVDGAACGPAAPEDEPLPADATGETEATIPGVVVAPSGSVTVTSSPAFTRYSWLTGSCATTTGVTEVAVSTLAPGCGGAPGTGVTPVTRSGPGA
jgi:hypothetical protein